MHDQDGLALARAALLVIHPMTVTDLEMPPVEWLDRRIERQQFGILQVTTLVSWTAPCPDLARRRRTYTLTRAATNTHAGGCPFTSGLTSR